MTTSSRSFPARSRFLAGLLVVVALGLAARMAAIGLLTPQVSTDSFSYLNLARQLRGIPMPSVWDDTANLPRDDQGARTPGYPWFLNRVFELAGHRPSPVQLTERLEAARWVDDWHLAFLRSAEDLWAVQVTQHAMGLLAALITYIIVWEWTARAWLAAATATLGVGLRPAWVLVFEPLVHTEVLGATLLLVSLWMGLRASRPGLGWPAGLAAMLVHSLVVLVRPPLAFGAPVLLVAVMGSDRRRWRIALVAALVWLLPLGAWSVRNGLRHDYWGLSPVLAQNLASHVRGSPELLADPTVGELCVDLCRHSFAGVRIVRALVRDRGLSYPAATERLLGSVLGAIRARPTAYLRSVARALGRLGMPPETLLPVWVPSVPRILGQAWLPALAAFGALGLAGLGALLVARPGTARLPVGVAVASSVGVAFTVQEPTDLARHAFCLAAPLALGAAATVDQLHRLAHRAIRA